MITFSIMKMNMNASEKGIPGTVQLEGGKTNPDVTLLIKESCVLCNLT